uniref:Mitofusin-2-like n=1 Tax=Saccoglossus kowalevskii TaxID=10224 RepID=A0ABM0MJ07_SACKO|nr:PREDICTED: mitofusin-2-like [Saccoglossus kowalevskii]
MPYQPVEDVHSPLKRFVEAKKQINDVFRQIVSHLEESVKFLEEISESVEVSGDHATEVQAHKVKVEGIGEVLARDHMKVAFFGRTSSGKSTVINAMLKDKVLPTGIGHTTDCFLSIEGSDTSEAYLIIPQSNERRNVRSVSQLAHALSNEKLADQSSLIHVFWPSSRCALLKDDLVLVDSPGVDVTADLDSWIDDHCLDADVFVLVANAESTLMRTEKSFFHKVAEKLSKPNIFILNNRWDASASEPDSMEDVKKQHLERSIGFLVEELKVITKQQAEDRVFFVSAKEALCCRIQKVQGMPEAGECKPCRVVTVSSALIDEIRRLSILVDEFDKPFHPDALVVKHYKDELQNHIEEGIGRNISARCSNDLTLSVSVAGKEMKERLSALLPEEHKSVDIIFPRSDFDLSYRLDCRHLCGDFKEDLEFKFSLGWTALVNRFLGPKNAKLALMGLDHVMPKPASTVPYSSSPEDIIEARNQDDLAVSVMTGLAALTSQTSMGLIVIAGIVWKAVGWRLLAVGCGLYGAVYFYERLTWTNKAKQRKFKKQFVEYATERLQLVVNFTSSNCSHQVQQELSSGFAQLCHQIDIAKDDLKQQIQCLDNEVGRQERIQNDAKLLRNKAGWLENELNSFINQYLECSP